MWETICDAQAGFWLNSKFLSKFSRKPLSGISDQKAPPPILENFRIEMTKVYSKIPPPPNFGKLQIWDDQSWLRNTPLPFSEKFRFEMTKVYSRIPSPFSEKFRFEMTKVYSRIPPPISENAGDRMWRLICNPQGYHSFCCCKKLWCQHWQHWQLCGNCEKLEYLYAIQEVFKMWRGR